MLLVASRVSAPRLVIERAAKLALSTFLAAHRCRAATSRLAKSSREASVRMTNL